MSNDILSTLIVVLERLVKAGDKALASCSSARQKKGTVFHAVRPPPITIRKYLERIVRYSVCNHECFVLGLVYIDRLTHYQPDFSLNSLNIHRLLITSFMLASKFYDDSYYNNSYFAKVGGVTTAEMNVLELEFLFLCQFSLFVEPDTFFRYRRELSKHTKPIPIPMSITPPPIAMSIDRVENPATVEKKKPSFPSDTPASTVSNRVYNSNPIR